MAKKHRPKARPSRPASNRRPTPTARRAARRPRRAWGFVAVLGILVAAGVALIVVTRSSSETPQIAGLRTYEVPSRNHVTTAVAYPQQPPVGGDHFPVWQNCGYYASPIPTEQGVHSLEHGAVWITYRPDLPAGQIARLRELARQETYVLVSPYPDLPSPVVASAWGRQVRLSRATDARLGRFIDAFRQGPQTPELGAVCTNGSGSPQ